MGAHQFSAEDRFDLILDTNKVLQENRSRMHW